MRSKNRRGHQIKLRPKHRSAYWRGEKTIIFFKKGILILSFFIFIVVVVLGIKVSARTFLIKEILISGNYHLEEEEVKNVLAIRDGENLLRLSFDGLEDRIKNIAWIKRMYLRKQFPHTLMVNVEEAAPKALLSLKRHLFLLDSEGNILEEIKDKGTPFLPVITEISPERDRGGILESLKLIDALDEENIISGKESIKIMLRSYGLLMSMDGEMVRVGYGGYKKKLERWKSLEKEIRRKNINIDYVDLRFRDKVIVKPVKTIKKSGVAGVK